MACKFDAFLDLDFGHPSTLKPTKTKVMNQGLLFANETDGSSYPSGGLRITHTAAAFVSWDKTSPPFVRGDTLYLPSGFITHNGEAQDHKTPLLRSQEAINKEGLRLLKLLGDAEASQVVSNVGWEQEYFIIDADMHNARPDLVASGRMLFGAISDRNQEGCENYFGIPCARAKSFFADVQVCVPAPAPSPAPPPRPPAAALCVCGGSVCPRSPQGDGSMRDRRAVGLGGSVLVSFRTTVLAQRTPPGDTPRLSVSGGVLPARHDAQCAAQRGRAGTARAFAHLRPHQRRGGPELSHHGGPRQCRR